MRMKAVACLALLIPLAVALPATAQGNRAGPAATPAASQSSGPALYLAGNAAVSDGRFDLALDYFSRAADLASGDARDSLRELAFESAVRSGNIPRAAQFAPQAESSAQVTRQLGQLVVAVDAMASGDARKSNTILTGNGVGQPFRALALMLQPWSAVAAGQKDPAIPEPPARSDPITRMYAMYNRALLLEFTGKTDQVEDIYKDLLVRGPDFLDFQYSLGEFLERQHRAPDAVKLYDTILEQNPNDVRATQARERARKRRPTVPPALTANQGAAQALLATGKINLAQNDTDGAITCFWLALRLDERRTEALFLAASVEAGAGSTEAARTHFARIPKDAPEYIDARIGIAESWMADHDKDRALAAARETVSKSPRDLVAKSSLAGFLSISGKSSEAVNLYSQVIRARGAEASWSLYYARAMSYNEVNEWKSAERDLNKALELSPEQPEVMNYLGYMWADRGERLPEALALLQKAARARPRIGAIIDSLGWVYFRMGDLPKAIENLEVAVVLDAADPSVNDHLGDAYFSAGRKLEAVYQWQRVLTLHPEDKLKASVQAKINSHQGAETVASASEPAPATP